MSEAESPGVRRSRKVPVGWLVAGILVALLMATCLLWVIPVLQARSVISKAAASTTFEAIPTAIEALGGQRKAAWKLNLYLQSPSFIAPDRAVAAQLLLSCGKFGLRPIVGLLGDRDSPMRETAARMLGAVVELEMKLPALRDPNVDVVLHLTLARDDADKSVRQAVVRALGKSGDQRAIAPLVELLSDQQANVREEAARALGSFNCTEARAALLKAANDEDGGVRNYAQESLKAFEKP